MKSVGPFQAAAPSQVDAGRPARASTETAHSGQVTRSNFRETLAQIKPTATLNHRQVQVQQGDTLIGLTRKYLHEQGQTATASEVHRVAMSVAQKNSLSNPNLIRTGQTLNFSAAHFAGTPSALKSREPVMAPTTNSAMPSRATLQAPSIAPTASSPTGTGPKIAIVGDSIAVGLGGALLQQSGITPEFAPGRKFLTQSQGRFAVNAVGGHSSPQILDQLNKHAGVKNAELAIISVGTNDFVNSSVNKYYTPERITQNLQRIRTELNAKERVWVLPYDPKARELVESVAKERGDKTIDLAQFQAADRYHPRNYAAIANSISPLVNQHSPSQAAASHTTPEQTWQSAHNALLARGTRF
jgi:hypothetical protein